MNVFQPPKWLSEVLVSFFTLSYPTTRPARPDSFPGSEYYNTGCLDGCFVLSWIVVLGVLRECLRLGVFEPFSRRYLNSKETTNDKAEPNDVNVVANGVIESSGNGHASIGNEKVTAQPKHAPGRDIVKGRRSGMSRAARIRERSVLRCAEQGWQLAYYVIYWPFGFYIHLALPSAPFRLDRLWLNYPHVPLSGPMKFYYLTQLGFWFHQMLLLNAEEWRKDHFQMMSHHIITISLIIASYYFNFTRVGVLIMVLMDWCDIFLALMKITRYLRLPERVTDTAFVIFSLSWIVTRHILFGIVIYSTYHDAPQFIPFAWAPEKGRYLTRKSHMAFICLLVALQLLLLQWLVMLCRLVVKILKGKPIDDMRSEDDGDSDNEAADYDRKKDK